MNNKQIQILNKYNCDINKLNTLIECATPEYKEINTHKLSQVINTSIFLGGREILINKIMKELKGVE